MHDTRMNFVLSHKSSLQLLRPRHPLSAAIVVAVLAAFALLIGVAAAVLTLLTAVVATVEASMTAGGEPTASENLVKT